MSILKLNINAKPWYPSSNSKNYDEAMHQIMEMSYEEFRQKLLTNTLPIVNNILYSFTPVLLRNTNVPYHTYPEWAYDHREHLNKLTMQQFLESSPFAKVFPENERIDIGLEELYEKEENKWIQEHPEIFVEDENVEW